MTQILLLLAFLISSVSLANTCTAKLDSNRYFPAGEQFGSDIIRAGSDSVAFTVQNSGQFLVMNSAGTVKSFDPTHTSKAMKPFHLSAGYFALGSTDGKLRIFSPTFDLVNTFDTGDSTARIFKGIQMKNGTIVAAAGKGDIYFFEPNGKLKKVFDASTFSDDSVSVTSDLQNLSDGNLLVIVNDNEDDNEHSLAVILDSNGNFLRKFDQVDQNQFNKNSEIQLGVIALMGRVRGTKDVVVEFVDYKKSQTLKTIHYAPNEYPLFVKTLGLGSFMIGVNIQPEPWVFNTRVEFYDASFTKISETTFEKTGFDLSWRPTFVANDTVTIPVGHKLAFFSRAGEVKYVLDLPEMPLDAPVVLKNGLLATKVMHGNNEPQKVFFISYHCSSLNRR